MSSFRENMKNNIIKPDPETPKKKDYDFRDVEFLAMIAHAIAGGVESPLQLAFQVSWILYFDNKRIPKEFQKNSKRIPKEFQKIPIRIPTEHFQKIPKEL